MSRALLTMYHGEYECFRPVTGPALEVFAERHGYTVEEVEPNPERHPCWSKLPALAAALRTDDVALWIDADVLVADPSADPADALTGDQFLATLADERYGICAALLAFKAGPVARDFLAQAWAMRNRDWPDWDQSAIQTLAHTDAYGGGIRLLGHDWFGPEGSTLDSRILHACRQSAPTVAERAALVPGWAEAWQRYRVGAGAG